VSKTEIEQLLADRSLVRETFDDEQVASIWANFHGGCIPDPVQGRASGFACYPRGAWAAREKHGEPLQDVLRSAQAARTVRAAWSEFRGDARYSERVCLRADAQRGRDGGVALRGPGFHAGIDVRPPHLDRWRSAGHRRSAPTHQVTSRFEKQTARPHSSRTARRGSVPSYPAPSYRFTARSAGCRRRSACPIPGSQC
jgi:hypothetical protein